MENPAQKPLRIYRASAGSGKTFTLAVEYIALLALNPMAYQNILAVTFTNKATAEMKQRILSTLYGIANGLEGSRKYVTEILKSIRARKDMLQWQKEPYAAVAENMDETTLKAKAKEALSNIIHDYSRFHVETIDSFFQGIVRELANELELSANMKVELDEKEVLGNAVDQIIENLKEGSNEFHSIIDFIEEKIRKGHAWQVDQTVKEFGRNIFKENYQIHGEEVRRKMTDYKSIFQYRQMLQSYLAAQKKRVTDLGEQFLAAYERCGMNEKDCTKDIVTFFQKVSTLRLTAPTKKSKGTFSDNILAHIDHTDKWFKKNAKNKDELLPHVEHTLIPLLKETYETYKVYLSHEHTTAAIFQHIFSLMLINEISEKVKELNEDGNRFLLSETANFLRNVMNHQDIPFIYEKTGAVIEHIMIDEFQDTSTLQWGNFKPLILNSIAMGGSCLIVGDVKQSIYRFRNSDWQILNNIRQDVDLREHMGGIPAEYNYRSAKRVVTFNNEIFQNAVCILKEDCPALDTAYGCVAQKAKREEETGYVRVENIDYHDIDPKNLPEVWDKNVADNDEEAMLQRIQLSVKNLIENGVNANDITILVRKNREVPLICDYFNEHQDVLHVKVVSDDAFRLDASPAINLIVDALRVLAAQDETLYLMALKHHWREHCLPHLLPQQTEEEGDSLPADFSKTARTKLSYKPLTEQVEEIYQIFHLNQWEGQDAYLFFFIDIVEQFCAEKQADLDSFLQAWDEELCEKTIPNGAAEGVRIMTMHASKGLEFHTAIIPFCTWSIKPNDKEVIWCVPEVAPYNQMPLLPVSVNKATDDSIFAADRETEELKTLVDNINILYVAFTRAKNNLVILTGNKIDEKADEDEKVGSAQDFLVKAMPERMEMADIEGCITTYQYGTIVPTEKEKKEAEKNIMECEYDAQPVSFSSYPASTEFRQSYESDMFITSESPNPTVQQHREKIRLISLGNLYHGIFEHIKTIDDVPHAIQLLESKGCFGSLLDAKEAKETVTQMILSISEEHPEWFSSEWEVLNERAILFLQDGVLSNKRPDRVMVKGKQAIIIDYKTAQGAATLKEDGTFSAPHENIQQMNSYKKLLAQMGYTHVQAFLWYILDKLIVPV